MSKKTPLMSHADRRKLIEQPFRSQLVKPKSWGGIYTGHSGSIQMCGQRTWTLRLDDESYIRYSK